MVCNVLVYLRLYLLQSGAVEVVVHQTAHRFKVFRAPCILHSDKGIFRKCEHLFAAERRIRLLHSAAYFGIAVRHCDLSGTGCRQLFFGRLQGFVCPDSYDYERCCHNSYCDEGLLPCHIAAAAGASVIMIIVIVAV